MHPFPASASQLNPPTNQPPPTLTLTSFNKQTAPPHMTFSLVQPIFLEHWDTRSEACHTGLDHTIVFYILNWSSNRYYVALTTMC